MRILIVLFLSLAAHGVFAQSGSTRPGTARPHLGNPDSVKIRQQVREAMVAAIQSGVGISGSRADSVYSAITDYRLKAHAVIWSRITKEQKDERIKSLAAERDGKIRGLLSADQVTKLNAVFSKNKQMGHGKK